MASHNEAIIINALIIMINEKRATITVKAFFSVKYFFIAVDLHEDSRLANIKFIRILSFPHSVKRGFLSTKNLL